MCSEKHDQKLSSSAEKKITKLTLFQDLLETSNSPSDCESGVSGGENERPPHITGNGLIRIGEGELIHGIIERKLVSGLNSSGIEAKMEAINRVDLSGSMSRARVECFRMYWRAVEMKQNGDANVKYAWFGGSKTEIHSILSHGFCNISASNPSHGYGVHLSPVEHPALSLQLASADEDGLIHMLLCRVIMGKMEPISRESVQYNPSREEFDSGVDDLASPRRYIVWSSRMNTHILPEFLVTFAVSSYQREERRNLRSARAPNSDWMPFPTLITALSKFLPGDAVESISKCHSDYRKQKVTRDEMIQHVRNIAGDNLLMAIIKSYRGKIKSHSDGAVWRCQRK